MSSEWNRENRDRVRAAQKRYYEARKQRRAELSALDRAREDLARVLSRLEPEDRAEAIEWMTQRFLSA